jgi:hypothetical protein
MTFEIFGNEIVMLSIGTGVLTFILSNRKRLKRLGAHRILIASFCLMQAGWIVTVVEGFIWEVILNYVEHACYAVSSILLMIWCWKVFGRGIPFYTRAHNTGPVSKETV